MTSPTTSPTPTPSPTPTVDQGALLREKRYEECRTAMEPFLDELQEVDSRLSVGLVIGEYRTLLGDARVAYDGLEFESLSRGCLFRVGVPAEAAFNKYVAALNQWDDCIFDFGCSTEDIESQLQAKWLSATLKIEKALNGLEALATP